MQINEYLYTATSVTDFDWLDLDKDLGGGAFQSQKLPPSVLSDFITSSLPTPSNIYNSDGTITGVTAGTRTVDLNTYKLLFANGNVYMATTGATGGAFRLEVAKSGSGGAIYASSGGVAGEFHGSGTAGAFFSASGLGIFSVATRNVFRDDGSASVPSAVPGSMFEIMSSGQGVRVFPRMVESNRDAIPTPPNGVIIHNTDTERPNMYHPTFGWVGLWATNMAMSCATTSTVTTGTYYFSMAGGLALRSTIGGLAIRPTRKGKITGASFTRFIAGTLGDRSYSLYVRINNIDDYLVATQGAAAAETFFENAAMGTTGTGISVGVTDSIVMKLVISGGTTDSGNVLMFGNLMIQ